MTCRDAAVFFDGWAAEGASPSEVVGYIRQSAGRFVITARELLDLAPRARVLEIGSDPYFFSLLMRRARPDLDWVTTNWHPACEVGAGPFPHAIVHSPSGAREAFQWYVANVETAPLPFSPGSFDAVAYCEVLEHLHQDPAQSLEHIHAMLRPGGLLLLTTPNPARSYNVQRVLQRASIYDPISGYGPHGRHNREYSEAELRDLLEAIGFDVVAHRTFETSNDWAYRKLLARFGYGEHHLVRARRRHGPTRRYRPRWLYKSFPESFFDAQPGALPEPTPSAHRSAA